MMETKLLPCPFCGTSYVELIEKGGFWGVDCDWCDAAMAGNYDTKEEAIEAWNTRHERTCRITMDWEYDGDLPAYYRWFVCSECKEGFSYYKHDHVSYCPNCGAKVVG